MRATIILLLMIKKLLLLPLLALSLLALLPAAANAFVLQYEGNGQTSGQPPASQTSDLSVVLEDSSMCKNGALFGGWNSADDGSGASYDPGDTFFPLTSNPTQTLYATWEDAPAETCLNANVSVEIFGPVGGVVTSTPEGIDCPTICLDEFPIDSSVTLSATPNSEAGVVFLRWSGACTGTSTECSIASVEDAKHVNAIFSTKPTYSLSVDKTGDGWGTVTGQIEGSESDILDCGALCQTSVEEGSTVVLEAAPNSSSQLSSWSEPGCTGSTCSVQMTNSKVVQVNFAALPASKGVVVRKTKNSVARKAGNQGLARASCLAEECQIERVRAVVRAGNNKKELVTVWNAATFTVPDSQTISVRIPSSVARNKRYNSLSLVVVAVSGTEKVQKAFRFPIR